MPVTRSCVVALAATERTQMIAIGAAEGNIIAAIITIQTDRNAARESPIVPWPAPIGPAEVMVTTHASAATRHRPIHQGRSCLSGTSSGGPALRLIGEVGDEAVGAGELRGPVVAVSDRASFGLGHRLRDRGEQRIGDDGWMRTVHADHLL